MRRSSSCEHACRFRPNVLLSLDLSNLDGTLSEICLVPQHDLKTLDEFPRIDNQRVTSSEHPIWSIQVNNRKADDCLWGVQGMWRDLTKAERPSGVLVPHADPSPIHLWPLWPGHTWSNSLQLLVCFHLFLVWWTAGAPPGGSSAASQNRGCWFESQSMFFSFRQSLLWKCLRFF